MFVKIVECYASQLYFDRSEFIAPVDQFREVILELRWPLLYLHNEVLLLRLVVSD